MTTAAWPTLMTPNGRLVRVNPNSVESALRQGYTRHDPNKAPGNTDARALYGDPLHTLVNDPVHTLGAYLGGAAAGASFEASDVLAARLSGHAEDIRKNYEQHPIATALGELTGMAALSFVNPVVAGERLVAGGASKAIGKIISSGIAKKAAGIAAKGATTGALYGAGSSAREAALNDSEHFTENLLGHVGLGALFGGTGELVLGGASNLASKVVQRISPTLKGAKEAADNFYIKAMGGTKTDIKRINKEPGLKEAVVDFGREAKTANGEEVVGIDSPIDLYEKVKTARLETGKALGDFRAQVDELTKGQLSKQINIATLREELKKEVIDPLYAKLTDTEHQHAAALEKELSPLFAPIVAHETKYPLEVGRVQRENAQAQSAYETATRDQEIRSAKYWHPEETINGRAGEAVRPPEFAPLPKLPPPTVIPISKLEEVRQSLAKQINFKNTPAHQDALRDAERLFEHTVEKATETAVTELSPGLNGKYMALKKLYRGAIESEQMAANAAAGSLGNRRFGLTDYVTGAAATVATGGLGVKPLAAVLIHKMARERGAAAAARGLDALLSHNGANTAVQSIARGTDFAIENFLKPVTRAARIQGQTRLADTILQDHADEYSYLASRPDVIADRLAPLSGLPLAPSIAMQLSAKASAATQFLASKAPKLMMSEASLTPWSDMPKTSKSELRTFERYLTAVNNPSTILADIGHGRITQEQAETLKTVYPKIYTHLIAQLTERASAHKKSLSYRQRMVLSTLTGTPLDPALLPAHQKQIQQAFIDAEKARQQQQDQQVQAVRSQVAERNASASQRAQSREF